MDNVAIIGTGTVGATLSRALVRAGQGITIGARQPDSGAMQAFVAELGDLARATSIHEAIATSSVVVLAVPGDAVAALIEDHAEALDGKAVIDVTNNLAGGHAAGSLSSLDHLTQRVPTAEGFRAFNSIGHEMMAMPRFGDTIASLFYAGPDTPSRAHVAEVISAVGFDPVYVGSGPDAHQAVDALAILWFALALGQGRGRRLAFRLLDPSDD